MPLSRYNAQFGGKKGSASKAYKAMQKQYGAKKGEQVFYATKNKAKNKQQGEQEDRVRRFIKRRKRGRGRGQEVRQ